MFCEEKCCEQTLVKDNSRLLRKRSVDEVRYGRLWAEVALPKLLEGGELPENLHILEYLLWLPASLNIKIAFF
jgi:hypothetical protein